MKRLALSALLLPSLLFSQNYKEQRNKLLLYNISLGAAIGGITELISNPREVHWYQALTHGFCMGALGGGFNFVGKYTTTDLIDDHHIELVWASRITNSIGNSIIYNTGHSRNAYFQYLNFDIAFIQLNIDVTKGRVKPKLLPGALAGLALSINKGGKFDIPNSLFTLTPIFSLNDTSVHERGYTLINSITLNKGGKAIHNGFTLDTTLAHEMIHVMQAQEYNNVANMVFGFNTAYKYNHKIWKYMFIDIPFSDIAYGLNDKYYPSNNPYISNFYEYEARSFSLKSFQSRK